MKTRALASYESKKTNIAVDLDKHKIVLMLMEGALDKINEAWKNASEELYKAQAEGQTHEAQPQNDANGDQTQDVDFEEVK